MQFQNRLNSRDNLEEKSRAKRESRARPRFHRGGEALQILMGKFTVPEPVTTVHTGPLLDHVQLLHPRPIISRNFLKSPEREGEKEGDSHNRRFVLEYLTDGGGKRVVGMDPWNETVYFYVIFYFC